MHPEDHGGETVSGWVMGVIGALLLPGILLLSHGVRRWLASSDGLPIRERIARGHSRVWSRAVESGVFPFPGTRLVASCKPLLAGEAAFAGVLALSFASPLSVSRAAGFAALAVAAGILVSVLSMRDLARRQILALRSALPLASFLLSLLLEAGIGSHVALEEVAKALSAGPLAEELGEISRSRKLGRSRKEAFDRSRRRIPLDDYHTFLNLVQQGEELGVGLSRALREHSGKLLEQQRQRAEAFAQKASVRILLPLVLFIFPAVFLVILSPVLLSLWEMWRR